VVVTWEDSVQPVSAWRFLADLTGSTPVVCQSVGWLVERTKDALVLAPNLGFDDDGEPTQAAGVVTIPARAVRKVRRLGT
jgi:hypothetical protein